MNKPISKHALRRAVEKVAGDGFIEYSEPVGTVVDKIWHEIERATFNGARKKAVARAGAKTAGAPMPSDGESS